MNVRIMVDSTLHEGKGGSQLKIPIEKHETVDTLLIKLSRRSPDLVESILDPRTGDLKKEFKIELNGRSIDQIKGLHTRLKNKDELTVTSQKES